MEDQEEDKAGSGQVTLAGESDPSPEAENSQGGACKTVGWGMGSGPLGAPYWLGNSQAGNFWGLEGTQSAHMGVRSSLLHRWGQRCWGRRPPGMGVLWHRLPGPLEWGIFPGDLAEPAGSGVLASGTPLLFTE